VTTKAQQVTKQLQHHNNKQNVVVHLLQFCWEIFVADFHALSD
jgi:hypothetical protein